MCVCSFEQARSLLVVGLYEHAYMYFSNFQILLKGVNDFLCMVEKRVGSMFYKLLLLQRIVVINFICFERVKNDLMF